MGDHNKITRREALEMVGGIAAVMSLPHITRASVPESRIQWYQTTGENPWVKQPVGDLVVAPSSPFDLETTLIIDEPAQRIEGFGGAFSELGWLALQTLSNSELKRALIALFSEDGCNFSLCRTPLAASDFARKWYSYDETPGDFELKNFSVANDKDTLIPYILAAQSANPELHVWASPWSPPTWMKRNGHYAMIPSWPGQPDNGILPESRGSDGNDYFILEEKYLNAYAHYFRRYIEEYRKAGIYVFAVMPQNEFNAAQPFPSCCWTPEGCAKFLPFLGSEMDKVGVEVLLGTINHGDIKLIERVLEDPSAAKFIKGLGVQWAGKDALPLISERYPQMRVWGTEHECGRGTNDWYYSRYGWALIKHYFKNGATVWNYWNMVLPEHNYSTWGWPQNSLIVVDPKTRSFRLTHDYWLIRHLASFVKPGAHRIPTQSFLGYEDQLAFCNPDGSLVIVVSNAISNKQTFRFAIGKQMLRLDLAPDSLNTIVIPREELA